MALASLLTSVPQYLRCTWDLSSHKIKLQKVNTRLYLISLHIYILKMFTCTFFNVFFSPNRSSHCSFWHEVDVESPDTWSPLPDLDTDIRAPEIATGNYNEMVDVFGLGVSWQLRNSSSTVLKKVENLTKGRTKTIVQQNYKTIFSDEYLIEIWALIKTRVGWVINGNKNCWVR